jgi:hypothetical protein
MDWLVVSIVASVVLTVVLNLALRLFPGAGDRAARRMETWAAPDPDDRQDAYGYEGYDDVGRTDDRGRRTQVRVFFPWKAMLIGSLLLTLLVNVVLRLG